MGRLNQKRISMFKVENKKGPQMEGDGFGDTVKNIFDKGVSAVKNIIPDSDDTARPSFPGENHMVLKLPNGKNGIANFMGPGTQIVKRLKRGDPGRTPSDTVAMMHDINYSIAQDAPDRDEQFKQVRKADKRMIKTLKKISKGKFGGDDTRNIQAGLRGIQSKIIGEDMGLLDKGKFSGPLKKLDSNDKILLNSKKRELEQIGYGLPGYELKMRLINKLKREKRGASYSKMGGKGLEIYGKFLNNVALPQLIKELKINEKKVPLTKLKPVIIKIIKNSGKLPKVIKNLSKTILPILTMGKMKTLGLSGKGYDTSLKKQGGLEKKLSAGLFSAFKYLASKLMKKQGLSLPGSGLSLPGSGLSLPGSGFFKEFKKGFDTTFKPGADLLGDVAILSGNPEIGIPLKISSKLL